MTTATASKFTFERLEDRIAPSALLIGAGLGLSASVGGGDCHTAAPPKDDFSACAPPKDDFSSSCRPSTPALGLKVGLNALLGVVLGGRH
ncbi:hypothetical protein [Schlesneria paludicola]|uniref:hypothetical protein n=1 Tax=Schlesneria paludicola TaxID=360056 RepID=UPI00029A6062|nr:hypothetical protein [Schlesneria paludicola]